MDKKVVVKIDHITKDYGEDRGNFDINLNVHEGEVVGLVGENGAGKTTLMRQLMGFIKPTKGDIKIYGLDAYKDAAEVKKYVGYVPGEINYPDLKSGIEFLNSYANIMGISDFKDADSIIKRLQLDIRAYPKRMSKGMKQKMAIVVSLIADAPLILMDEPTTGLDPLMRDEFLQIVLEQKAKGKTIMMSSNNVDELEKVCDRVALISKGRIQCIADISKIKNRPERDYKIEFENKKDYENFIKGRRDIIRLQPKYNQVSIRLDKKKLEELFDSLNKYKVKFMTEIPYDLNKYFKEFLMEESKNGKKN